MKAVAKGLFVAICLVGLSESQAQVNYQLSQGNNRYVVNNVQYGRLASSSTVLSDCTSCGPGGCSCESRAVGPGAGGAQANVGDMGGDMGTPDLSADLGGPVASSSVFGASSGGFAASPGMIGDFFNGGLNVVTFGEPSNVSTAGGDRRFKFAENTSPFPQDRFFFNYHHFTNPVLNAGQEAVNVDRFVFGLEKTFLDRMLSAEIRIPFAMGLASDQQRGVLGDANESTEFGNIVLAGKVLLYTQDQFAVSGGLAVSLPTGSDAAVFDNGALLIEIENEAVHLQPFMAMTFRPDACTWVDFYAQLDYDTNGSGLRTGTGDTSVIRDQTFLFLDMSIGRWVYRNNCNRFVRGIAPIFELHYSTTTEDTNAFRSSGIEVLNLENRQDMLNATGGLRFMIGDSSFLTLGAVAPLFEQEFNVFDSEIAVQFTRLR